MVFWTFFRLTFLRSGIPPAIIGDALRRLEDIDGPLYLHVEKGLYYFSSIVGLNRLIVEKEEVIREDEIEKEAKRRIEKISGTDFDVYKWPRSNSDVPDNKRLKLAILPFDLMVKDPQTEKFIQDVLTRYSTGFRIYKNSLMFSMIDPNEYDAFKRAIRRFLALDAIKADKEKMKTLTEEDRERVNQKLKDTDSSIWFKIISVYRYLAKASRDGVATFDMGIPTVGERPTLTGRIKDYLKYQDIRARARELFILFIIMQVQK